MEILLAIFALAGFTWALAYVWRGSLLVGCLAVLATGYVLTNHFWKLDLGSLSINASRALFIGLMATLAWRWRQGLVRWQMVRGCDWFVVLFTGYITLHFLTTESPGSMGSSVSASWRLIECFWVPLALYLVARTLQPTERAWKTLLIGFSVLGLYLACTAFGEITGNWWAVFPRYIADSDLGAHFGRARGPALNSVSLGAYLSVCFWACWFLWPTVSRPWQLALGGALALIGGALLFTYTRSCWLALAATMAVIPLLQAPRSWRPVLFGGLLIAAVVAVPLVGGKLVDMDRQDSNGSASHSVYQRQTFFIVSMRMFADHPVLGCGFGRFYDKKLPYLANRSQQIELESIRNLDHHNTFLSLLTETGLVGFSLSRRRTAWP